jgi:predicted RNase H-like HicB family nuclease
MLKHFTLEYWRDNDWFVGKLSEVPGIFSQGKTLDELEDNIRDAYHLMLEDEKTIQLDTRTKEIGIEV